MRGSFALATLLASTAPVLAQDDGAFVTVDLRVTEVRPDGTVVIDRGTELGLELADLVMLYPAGNGTYQGRIVDVAERRSVVELYDASTDLVVGSRGEVFIARERLAGRAPRLEKAPDHPPWEVDDDWQSGMPLLAEVGAVRPEERSFGITGRVYAIADQTWTSDSDRGSLFYRTGAEVFLRNPWGAGEEVHLDGELNYRRTDLPDEADEEDKHLRIDRASYAVGGTRFEPDRWEAGRFLQEGMPELGVLDGYEWSRRRANGHSWGTSVGFLPEPDQEYHSAEDFQLAAHYRWVADDSERLAVQGAVQKTWHNGESDRDLLLAKVTYLPLDGWDFHSGMWLDVYGSDEDKPALELTQMYATTTRRFESGNGLTLTFDHLRYPELLRDEFTTPEPDELADGGYDRLTLGGWRRLDDERRIRGRLSGWTGDGDSGGDIELSLDVDDLWSERGRATFTIFESEGAFSAMLGARLNYLLTSEQGSWDLFYEIARNDQDGFEAQNDDLLQHRLRLGRSMHDVLGWNVSAYVESTYADEEFTGTLGFYLQRGF